MYIYSGLAGFRHNPKRDGVALQPLGTEGQGSPGAPEPYSLWQVAIPMGMGISYKMNQSFSIDAMITYRLTFTDYLDDASTFYYDKAELEAARGIRAVEFADPSSGENPGWTAKGAIRGNPESNDTYYSFTLAVN